MRTINKIKILFICDDGIILSSIIMTILIVRRIQSKLLNLLINNYNFE